MAAQVMMGTSLAACAGLRAWLPMLVVSVLARAGYVHLHPSFQFLTRDDAVTVFAVATALELLGDKVIAIDHLLDVVGTVLRPAVGTVLASSMLTEIDPVAAVVLGLVAGGGPSLSIHAGKAVARIKASSVAGFHGGGANVALSVTEDLMAGLGLWVASQAPALGFVLALLAVVGAIWLVVKAAKTVKRLLGMLSPHVEGMDAARS